MSVNDARIRYQLAQDWCPHWDYESDGDMHACCVELRESERQYRALKALSKPDQIKVSTRTEFQG